MLENLFSAWHIASVDPQYLGFSLVVFGMIIVYVMITSNSFVSKLLGVVLLILAFRFLVI